jgi:dTDP-4-amino-4,6-dideoxygalactose transaminase
MRGVGTSVHFIPIPQHPFFSQLPMAGHGCPRARELYPRIVSLPLYPAMSDGQVEYVAWCVSEVAKSVRRMKHVAPGAGMAAIPLCTTE